MISDLLLPDGTVIPEEKRQPCEVYSRVVGYLRPVRQWNKGQKAIWNDRTPYIAPAIESPEVEGGSDA
jgi:hypothetical protein